MQLCTWNFKVFVGISGGYLGKYWGEGQVYCFDKMTLHFSIVLEQNTIVFKLLGVFARPLRPQVSATDCNKRNQEDNNGLVFQKLTLAFQEAQSKSADAFF